MKLSIKIIQKGFTPLEVQPARGLDNIFSANPPAAQSYGGNQLTARLLTGFTLVELLVVLAIIGVLIMGALAILSDAKARARDSRRVGDILVLHQALAMYLSNHDRYPVVMASAPGIPITGNDLVSVDLKNNVILYADLVDPRSGQDINGETFNYYYYTDAEGKTYTLTYCLETTSIKGKQQGCNNTETY